MKLTLLIVLAATATFFSSCNTTIGLGRDMRILGESMETQATKRKGTTYSDPATNLDTAPVY